MLLNKEKKIYVEWDCSEEQLVNTGSGILDALQDGFFKNKTRRGKQIRKKKTKITSNE